MTNPVIPPTPIAVPIYPPLGSPTFNQDAYTYGTTMPSIMVRIGEISSATYQNAVSASESAVAAAAAKSGAQDASGAALAAANFKGYWNQQVGQLLRPASVLHNGQYWMLLQNLPDVTLSEPGVDTSSWAPLVDLKDTVITATGGVIDCSKGDTFILTVSGNVTLSFTNIPAKAYEGVIELLHNSGVITIPSGSVWAGGKVPEFLTNKRHLLFFHRSYTGSGGWILSTLDNSAP